jgi:hypothetical protein
MKIAITGHSRGLGAELKSAYEQQGHQVSGFSRSNGHDLRDWDIMQDMLTQIADHDMFINLAKPDFVQTTILYALWQRWKNKQRIIVNIGSGIVDCPTCPKELADDPGMDAYRTAKISLREASQQLSFKSSWPRILQVDPLHLYGDPITDTEQKKLELWVKVFLDTTNIINDNGMYLKRISF